MCEIHRGEALQILVHNVCEQYEMTLENILEVCIQNHPLSLENHHLHLCCGNGDRKSSVLYVYCGFDVQDALHCPPVDLNASDPSERETSLKIEILVGMLGKRRQSVGDIPENQIVLMIACEPTACPATMRASLVKP